MNAIEQLQAADKAAKEARARAIANPTPENIAKADEASKAQDRAWAAASAANQRLIDELAAGTDVMARAIRNG